MRGTIFKFLYFNKLTNKQMQIELTAAELELIQAALHELKRRKKQRI